jgi:putative FmdB family regulatory protein
MPLYEYECTACHRHTEKIQKFSDPEITICPHCGAALKRVISAPAFSLKGGGWYKDGYGSSKPNSTGEGSGGGEKTASDKSGDSASATPASTSSESSAPAPAPAAASAASSTEKK